MLRLRSIAAVCCLAAGLCGPGRGVSTASEPRPRRPGGVSFRNDVMAVLSRAGCNQGVCHGNRSGKGGFKLSLRGQDPARDFEALTRDVFGRRIGRSAPESSLILLKPTARVPHEGGRRFEVDSDEYRILEEWIAAGAPRDPVDLPRATSLAVSPREAVVVEPRDRVAIRVLATFSDGGERDVSQLAVYEPSSELVTVDADGVVRRQKPGEVTVLVRYLHLHAPVRLAFVPAREAFAWSGAEPANYIDEHVFAKLRSLRVNPSEDGPDAVFVRRVYLDLLGLLPDAEEAREFLRDRRADRRRRLVDALLERPEFAEFWAVKWSDLLRNEEKVLDRKGVQAFHHWIRRSIARGKPLDRFARELIAARGSTYRNPPANYYRANRDPVSRAEATAQTFLGLRIQCAKCHNHPFDRWTQDDYYSWTALFARVRYKILENRRRDSNDKHEFRGEQIVWMAREGEVEDPRTGKKAAPRFLGHTGDRIDGDIDGDVDRLEALAEWVASPENPFFARVQVNRIWYHLMGRGLVDPIDDFRATNPASHPELLDALTRDFVASGFDLRHVIRTIVLSRTYQLSSLANETNADDEINYSHNRIRRLSSEQIVDALSHLTGVPLKFNGYPPGTRAAQVAGVSAVRPRDSAPAAGDRLLKLFGKPPRLLTCECERSDEVTLAQTFQLISGPAVQDLLSRPDNCLGRLLEAGETSREIVEELYWIAFSRPPTSAEIEVAVSYLEASDQTARRAALEDVLWGILNAKEFLLRR